MATTTTKATHRLIRLNTGEAAILSLVAAHASEPGTQPDLIEALAASTRRAQAIGHVILGTSKKAKPEYKLMAKRFMDAKIRNDRNARVLSATLQPFGR